MSQPGAEPAPWLLVVAWGLRQGAVLIGCCALLFGVALPLLVSGPARFEAESFVVARQLEIPPAALPSYAQEIFESDAMQRRLAASVDLSDGIDDADRFDVVALEEARVFGVVAAAHEPGNAAQLADLAAQAYVSELNRGGSGVGRFAVQSAAEVPTDLSTEGLSRWVTAMIGVAAGALLGCAVALLLVAARRPVLRARDVTSAIRQPLVGVVLLPVTRAGQPPNPRDALGLIPVAKALLPHIDGTVVFASAERTAVARGRLLALLATVLSTRLDVFVSGSQRVTSTVAHGRGAADSYGGGRAPRAGLELVDGAPPADTLDVPQWRLPMLLVISYGEPRAALRRLAADNFDEEILGVVMVDERRRSDPAG